MLGDFSHAWLVSHSGSNYRAPDCIFICTQTASIGLQRENLILSLPAYTEFFLLSHLVFREYPQFKTNKVHWVQNISMKHGNLCLAKDHPYIFILLFVCGSSKLHFTLSFLLIAFWNSVNVWRNLVLSFKFVMKPEASWTTWAWSKTYWSVVERLWIRLFCSFSCEDIFNLSNFFFLKAPIFHLCLSVKVSNSIYKNLKMWMYSDILIKMKC